MLERLAISLALIIATSACGDTTTDRPLEERVRDSALEVDATALEPLEERDPDRVELGRMLFYDRELSGNRDISCATCHHASTHTGDDLAVSIGVGGEGLGAERELGEDRELIPRNATEIFNRGAPQWRTMFWDIRVRESETGHITTPAGGWLPTEIDNVLAAQAMFPVTSRDEMRGERGDVDVNGDMNELAMIYQARPYEIWEALMVRLLAIDEYVDLFEKAFPDVPTDELGFGHAALAIADFEAETYHFTESPWDRFMRGEDDALTHAQKRGAELFFGKGKCADCHNGPLFTDQDVYNIAVPQLGPGKGNAKPLDNGFGSQSGRSEDAYRFRTPPLRNVTLTGPWMHNGAYYSLEGAIRHHLDPVEGCTDYDREQLPDTFRETVKEGTVVDTLIENVDAPLDQKIELTDAEVDDLVAFMEALTDPAAKDLAETVPDAVPSGLPVD